MTKKVFITLFVLAIAYWFLFDFLRWNQYDSPGFTGGARLLFGLEGGFDFQSRITKPLVLIFPGLMEKFTGLDPGYSFLFQNIVFFFLCGFFIYKILFLLFKNENTAYAGMLAYCTCQPFAVYSLFILSDVAGWFFGIVAIYLTLKFFREKNISWKTLLLAGFVSGAGCTAKESAVVGFIFLCCRILFSETKLAVRIKYLVISLTGFVLPVMVSFFLINYFFGDTFVHRIGEAYTATKHDTTGMLNVFQQLYRTADVFWLLFATGLYSIISAAKKERLNATMKTFLAATVLTFALLPVWPYAVDRIFFLAAPLLVVPIAIAAREFQKYSTLLVATGGLLNVSSAFLIYKFNTGGVIIAGAGIYLALLFFTWYVLLHSEKKSRN